LPQSYFSCGEALVSLHAATNTAAASISMDGIRYSPLAVLVSDMLFLPRTVRGRPGSVAQMLINLIFFEKSLKFSIQGALLQM